MVLEVLASYRAKLQGLMDVSQAPKPADAIFVFAGKDERKHYGLHLFRDGIAPRLILSVGRFEWRKFAALGLPSDGGLVDLVQATKPERRHFFVSIDSKGAVCERVPRGRLGTLTEARALARRVGPPAVERLILVSSPAHLRRCVVALSAFADPHLEILPVACPTGCPDSREEPAALGAELLKLLLYRVLASVSRSSAS